MATTRSTTRPAGQDETDSTAETHLDPEEFGEIEKEKTIPAPKLGGAFTFRLPYAMDEIKVLRRRAEIVGLPEALAGAELLGYAHARALFDVYCIHQPHDFRFDPDDKGNGGLKSWVPFLTMMEEVRDWHARFRRSLGDEEE